MTRRDRRRDQALARAGVDVARPRQTSNQYTSLPKRRGPADRKALLLGTALASTLLVIAIAPTPAVAVVGNCALPGVTGSDAVRIADNAPIVCNNVLDRYEGGVPYAVSLYTNGASATVTVTNTGDLTTGPVADTAFGLYALTLGPDSTIDITNSGDVAVTTVGNSFQATAISAGAGGAGSRIIVRNSGYLQVQTNGIGAYAAGISAGAGLAANNPVDIVSSGDMRIATEGNYAYAFGINADTNGAGDRIAIQNSGSFRLSTNDYRAHVFGITAHTNNSNAPIDIRNSGDISATARGLDADATGIDAYSDLPIVPDGPDSPIRIDNSGGLTVTTFGDDARAIGIHGRTRGVRSPIDIDNSGAITATANRDNAYGIRAITTNSAIDIDNSGDITATIGGNRGGGIFAGSQASLDIDTSGDITVTGGDLAFLYGINAFSTGDQRIKGSGDIMVTGNGLSFGISAVTNGAQTLDISGDITVTGNTVARGISAAPLGASHITSSGDIVVVATGPTSNAAGIDVFAVDEITIINSGGITSNAAYAFGIRVNGTDKPVKIDNRGDVTARSTSSDGTAIGINAASTGSIEIHNSGSVYAQGGAETMGPVPGNAGIFAYNYFVAGTTSKITNTGEIGASSHRAIDVKGAGTAHIYNAGLITGFVDLTDQHDRFSNQSGGVFRTKLTSVFGGGDDLFANEVGGTVQAATDVSKSEISSFEGLETFRNRGLISMVDGGTGDMFTISNTVGGTDLNFQGGGTLALDVFLDGAGSPADTFNIQGNVSGVTTVVVNNTNVGPGTFNPDGIEVIFVDGATPSASNFQLAQPVDTGFFDYDLFFVPTNSGFWELRSFTGAGAFLLPQLVTAAQDIWHQGSSTWFDRTADLRVLLAGGMAPTAYDPSGKSLGGKTLEAAGPYPLTPAVWARGSGSWLDRDDTARTSAYGRNYSFNLDRELTTLDFQVGVDLGQHDVWSAGDALVFGMLGGFVYGGLDYDAIPRSFDFSGGQVGAYATYMNGGLFVDTLLNVHLYELSTATLGFPSSLDANTVGLRTDAGYRFGSFTGGAFLEPLATIEVTWADIDGFSLGGNRVSFDDDANVRGRLGLRAGTTMEAWHGTLMEPFVIGSVWGNLSDDNSATLVSTGRTFRFEDSSEDVWGEISGGVNFFNVSQTTAVFAKVDVTVGDDISGVGGKAGMRVNW